MPAADTSESRPMLDEPLRLEFTTATTLNPATGKTGEIVRMQPFVRKGDRWKKAGCGLVADSVRDHLRTIDFAFENDQLDKVLDPLAHLAEQEATSDAR